MYKKEYTPVYKPNIQAPHYSLDGSLLDYYLLDHCSLLTAYYLLHLLLTAYYLPPTTYYLLPNTQAQTDTGNFDPQAR